MDQPISFNIDPEDVDDADTTLRNLIVGTLHSTAPDDVSEWTDVPVCIRDQWAATNGAILNWYNINVDKLADPENPPRVHVNWICRVPDGLIPWGDGGDTTLPMGAGVWCEWVNPTPTPPPAFGPTP
jgi:hypothetical protein